MFDTKEYVTIPGGLDEMAPGAELAVMLSSIDLDGLSGHDRVVVLQAWQRQASHDQAQTYAAMASVAGWMEDQEEDDPYWAAQAAAAEIRVALRLTRRAADYELALALDLKERLPQVLEALAGGVIDVRRARTMVGGTCHLSQDTARAVVDQVIDQAPRLTTGQLAARIRRLCIEADPDQAQRRYEEAVEDRRVVTEATDSGTAHLMGLDLPPHRVQAVSNRINRLARSLKTSDEPRTMDQLRADVLLDVLSGQAHHQTGSQGSVDISVDLKTLAGLSDDPGELAGYGPVIADIARKVAEEQDRAQWRYTVTDPHTGLAIEGGTTQRRPTADQQRQVQAANPTCIFPGCRMPATDCDLDHRIPYSEGGATTPDQLVPLCRHDHRIRHRAGWKHQPLPGGDHRWTTRLGHSYTTSGKPP